MLGFDRTAHNEPMVSTKINITKNVVSDQQAFVIGQKCVECLSPLSLKGRTLVFLAVPAQNDNLMVFHAGERMVRSTRS